MPQCADAGSRLMPVQACFAAAVLKTIPDVGNVRRCRYGRVRKRIVKFHPFDKDVEVSDGDYRRVEGRDGESMEVLARAGGRMFSSDMEKINTKVQDRTYDIIEKMQVDLFLIVMYTLLNQLNERERMKRLCDSRGATFGGAEPSLLAPVTVSYTHLTLPTICSV
eukprot:3331573-Rhodomonas_salina.6